MGSYIVEGNSEYMLDELLKVKGHSRTIILFLWKFAAENPVCFTEHKENISRIRDCLAQIGLDMGTATRPLKVWNDYIRKNKGNLNKYLEERGKADKSFRDWIHENKANPRLLEWMDLSNEQFKVTKRSPMRPEGLANYNSDSDNTDKDHSSDIDSRETEQDNRQSIPMHVFPTSLPPITGNHMLPPVKTENAEHRKRAIEEQNDAYKGIPIATVLMNNNHHPPQKVPKIDKMPLALPSMQTVVNSNVGQLLPGDRVRVDLGDGQLLVGEVYAVVGKIYYVDVNGMSIQTLRNRLALV